MMRALDESVDQGVLRVKGEDRAESATRGLAPVGGSAVVELAIALKRIPAAMAVQASQHV